MNNAAQPGSELKIRPLSAADLSAMMPIEHEAFSTPWRESTFYALMLRRDSTLIGALRDERLVGYAVCWVVGDQAELGNVAVASDERGHGVGRRLVGEILDSLQERGVRECFLEVRVSNQIARSLYEKYGFRIVGKRRNYYSKPLEDALVMRREFVLA